MDRVDDERTPPDGLGSSSGWRVPVGRLRRLGKRRLRWVAEAILRHHRLVVGLVLLVTLVCGYGVRWLAFNPDSRVFFGPDDPERVALEAMENTYSRANNVVFVLAPESGRVFERETLTAIAWLTERAWYTPFSSRVYSLTDEQHSYARGDEVVVENLVPDPAKASDADLERVRRTALDRVDLAGRMVSSTADVASVMVLVNPPGKSRDEVPAMAAFARALAAEFEQRYPAIAIYVTGGVIGDAAFAEAGRRDILTLVPIMVALAAVTLLLGLRSLYGTLATACVIAVSVVTTMGLAGWIGVVLNPATASAPIVVMVLSLATCVHIVSSTARELAHDPHRPRAVMAALRENAFPVFVNNLTTVVGFLALGFSISPPLQELGNIVSAGTLVALVYSFTVLPAVLVLLPLRADPEGTVTLTRRALRRLAEFVLVRQRVILIASGLVLVVLGAGMTRLTFDDDFIHYFDESYRFRTDTDFMQNRLTGLHVLQYSIPSGEEQGIMRPDYLRLADDFAEWFRQQPKVAHVSTITEMFKRLNMNMNGDDPAYYRIPESRELAAQYLLFYELSLPFGQDLNQRIDIARSAARVTVFLANASSDDIRELGARGEAWLREHAPRMAAPATGLSLMYAYVSERNVRGMLLGTALGLVVISGMLIAALRSVSIGLLSLLPNFFPAFMAFGLWGYIHGEVNLAVSVVAITTFGIVVDDTVHILSYYLHARRRLGLDQRAAIFYCFDTAGFACLLTTIALGLGFAVLALSGFAVTSQLGLLSALTMLIAWFGDYVCLPPLLMLLDRRRT